MVILSSFSILCGNRNRQSELLTSSPSCAKDLLWMPYSCGTGLVCAETFASLLRIADDEEESMSKDCDDDQTLELTTILYSLIRWRRWDAALERLNQCPQEASVWIVTGTVAEQYQRDHGMNASTSSTGYLPLHLVCMETTRQHRLIQELIQVYPAAVKAKDPMGRLPLHLFCLAVTDNPNLFCSQNNVESVRTSLHLLLDYYPEAMYVQDHTQLTPLSVITNAVQRRGRTELTEVLIATLETLSWYHSKHPNPPKIIDFPPHLPFLADRPSYLNEDGSCFCTMQPPSFPSCENDAATFATKICTDKQIDAVKLLPHRPVDGCDKTFISCSTPLSPTSIILHFSSTEGSFTYGQPHEEETNQLQLPCMIDNDDVEPKSFNMNTENELRTESSQYLESPPPLLPSANPLDTPNIEDNDQDCLLLPTETEMTNGKSSNIEEGKRCSWDSLESPDEQEVTDCDTIASTNYEALDKNRSTTDNLEPCISEGEAQYLPSKIMELELTHRKITLQLRKF